MESQNNKEMFKGDWSCSNCGGSITELPFEPRSTENLLCRDCHSNKRPRNINKGTHSGDWKCSSCGGSITELPFEPRSTENLLCKECFKKSKGIT